MMEDSYSRLVLWMLNRKPTRPADDYDDIAGFEPTEGY